MHGQNFQNKEVLFSTLYSFLRESFSGFVHCRTTVPWEFLFYQDFLPEEKSNSSFRRMWSCMETGVGLDDPYESFLTQNSSRTRYSLKFQLNSVILSTWVILWFYSVKVSSRNHRTTSPKLHTSKQTWLPLCYLPPSLLCALAQGALLCFISLEEEHGLTWQAPGPVMLHAALQELSPSAALLAATAHQSRSNGTLLLSAYICTPPSGGKDPCNKTVFSEMWTKGFKKKIAGEGRIAFQSEADKMAVLEMSTMWWSLKLLKSLLMRLLRM